MGAIELPSAPGTPDPTPLAAGVDAIELVNGSWIGGNLRVGASSDAPVTGGPVAGAAAGGSDGSKTTPAIAAACAVAAAVLAIVVIVVLKRRRPAARPLPGRSLAQAHAGSSPLQHSRRRKVGDAAAADEAAGDAAAGSSLAAALMTPQLPLFAHAKGASAGGGAGKAGSSSASSALRTPARDAKSTPVSASYRGGSKVQGFTPAAPATHVLALSAVPGAFAGRAAAHRGQATRLQRAAGEGSPVDEVVAEASDGNFDAAAAVSSGRSSPGSNGRSAHHRAAAPSTPIAIRVYDGRGSGGKSAALRQAARFAGGATATAMAERLPGASTLTAAMAMTGIDGGRAARAVGSDDGGDVASDDSADGDSGGPDSAHRHDSLADPSIARARQTLTVEAAARVAISAAGQRVRGRPAAELTAAAIKRRLIQPRRVVAVLSSATSASATDAAAGAAPASASATGGSATAAAATAAGAAGRTGPRRHGV